MNKFALFLLGALVALAASCTSPLTTLVGSKTPATALGAHDAQLVFQASATESRAVTGDTYLTVQLKSAADGTVKFASATGANGTYTVTVGGMVAGDWNLKVMLYDSQASQVLKYYGNKTQYIAVGSSNNVTVPLYAPGTVNGVTFTDALLAHHVTITDPNGLSAPAAPQPVVIGTSWDLDAQTYSSTDDTTPATQPGVLWTSSDENVATVTANGRVFVQKKGTATITALSAENHLKTASYDVAGVPAVYGTWRQVKVNYSSSSSTYRSMVIWSFAADTFVQYRWSNEGDIDVARGDFSFEQGILSFRNIQFFDPSSKAWNVVPPGEINPEEITRLVNITSETLTMAPIHTLVPPPIAVIPSNTSRSRETSSPIELYIRIPEVPLTGITINGLSSGGTLTLPKDIPLATLFEQENTPANAAVTGLYWTSNQPAVIGYTPDGRFMALTSSGSAMVTAYALNDLATPIATFTVNAAPNLAPQVTFNPNVDSISFTITDEYKIQSYNWSISGGTTTTVPNPFNPNAPPLGKTAVDSAPIPSTAGDYTLTVTTFDDAGNNEVFTHPFTVEAPQVTFTAPDQDFLPGEAITFTLTDVEGIASFTWNNGYDSGTVTVDGLGAKTVNFSILAPTGQGSHTLTVIGVDTHGVSETFPYPYLVLPPS